MSTVIATFLIWNTVAMAMTILRLHPSANTYVAISTPGKLPSIVKSFTCNKGSWPEDRLEHLVVPAQAVTHRAFSAGASSKESLYNSTF